MAGENPIDLLFSQETCVRLSAPYVVDLLDLRDVHLGMVSVFGAKTFLVEVVEDPDQITFPLGGDPVVARPDPDPGKAKSAARQAKTFPFPREFCPHVWEDSLAGLR